MAFVQPTASPHGHTPQTQSNTPPALAPDYIQGIYLNLRDQILITHRELAILRRYAALLRDKPQCEVHIVTSSRQRKGHYIAEALKHFGVSCGQIAVKIAAQGLPKTTGVWLLVTER